RCFGIPETRSPARLSHACFRAGESRAFLRPTSFGVSAPSTASRSSNRRPVPSRPRLSHNRRGTTMETSWVERRRYARHPIRVPVEVRPRGAGPDFVARVADLSEGGVAFVSPAPIAPDEVLDISLPVGDQRFTVAASVI